MQEIPDDMELRRPREADDLLPFDGATFLGVHLIGKNLSINLEPDLIAHTVTSLGRLKHPGVGSDRH